MFPFPVELPVGNNRGKPAAEEEEQEDERGQARSLLHCFVLIFNVCKKKKKKSGGNRSEMSYLIAFFGLWEQKGNKEEQ